MDIKKLKNIIREIIKESYTGVYGLTPAIQQNMDWTRNVFAKTGMFGPETQKQTDEFNDNINRDLNNPLKLDNDTWSRKPDVNRGMFTEEEINELFPNAATMKGEALPYEPKIPLYPDESRKDQLTIQLRKRT